MTASEVSDGKQFDVGTVKALAGGDTLLVHAKYGPPFEFRPKCKLWLAANKVPQAPSDDSGMRRRLRILPFSRPVPPDMKDAGLRARLANSPRSRAAFLAWAVRGLPAWRDQGLGTCEMVEQASAQ